VKEFGHIYAGKSGSVSKTGNWLIEAKAAEHKANMKRPEPAGRLGTKRRYASKKKELLKTVI